MKQDLNTPDERLIGRRLLASAIVTTERPGSDGHEKLVWLASVRELSCLCVLEGMR